MSRPRYWTDDRREQLRKMYLEEAQLGMLKIVERVASRLAKSHRSVDAALHALPDYVELRHKAHNVVREVLTAPNTPEHDPADPALRKAEQRIVRLADDVRQLRTKLKHSDRTSGIVLELADTMERMIEPIIKRETPHPYVVKAKDEQDALIRTAQEPVDAVVTLSDQHGDRVVRTEGSWGLERYDFNAFRCRLWEWAKMVGRYCSVHLPNYRFETLWVWHLGDAVNGDIHNMKHKNHFSNSMIASLAVGDAQAEALVYLSQFFKRVVVVCVPGNHGRTTSKIEWEDPYDNWDYLVAKTMKLRVDGHDEIEIITPRAWSAFVEVRGYLWNLNHGHAVKGALGIPWYGFEKREGRVQRLASFNNRPIDYFAYGHFHTPMTRPTGRGKAIHAGAWYMTDEFALNQLSVGNVPEQSLLVFSERFGRQFEIPLMVRDEAREQKMYAGEYTPPFGRHLVTDEPDAEDYTAPIIT